MKEKTYLIKFDFQSPLHLGEPGISMERTLTYVPSDTLFSALCDAWALIYGKGELEGLLQRFGQDAPFQLSSAFPRLTIKGNNQQEDIFYLPKPLMPPRLVKPGSSEENQREREIFDSALRRTKGYLNLEFFNEWIAHPFLPPLQAYESLETASLLFDLVYNKTLLARVSLDRVSSESNLFFCQVARFGTKRFVQGRKELTATGGLFCLLRTTDETVVSRLGSCFTILGEQGIGGERSVGCGKFKADLKPGDNLIAQTEPPEKGYITLSLYHPSPPERELIEKGLSGSPSPAIGYELVKTGGWIDSPFITGPQRKTGCFMFREGSVFPFEPKGEIVDVTPTPNPGVHHVYRNGIAFNMGVVL
jgi:CRISPR-associated protein Csm4